MTEPSPTSTTLAAACLGSSSGHHYPCAPLRTRMLAVDDLAEKAMAAWQFDVMATFEDSGTELPPALRTRAEKLLVEGFGPPRNITPHWLVFEDGGGNQIELLSSHDGSCELWARIDARTDAESFLTCLIVFLIEMECDLYAPELDRRFAGHMDLIKEALQASTAWRFALDRH